MNIIHKKGFNALWGWFGLDHTSWLTIPRVLLHSMPDNWQQKMADLLQEYDNYWDFSTLQVGTKVQITNERGKLIKTPEWLLQYRRPNYEIIESLKKKI